MATTSIESIEICAMISFRSKNPNDPVLWRGTLEALGTYRSIRGYGNTAAYNEGVRQVDNTVPSDVTLLSYFLITVDNSATDPTMEVFAQEWIEPGSLNVLNPGNKVKIEVTDPGSNTQQILSILANAGYACKVIA